MWTWAWLCSHKGLQRPNFGNSLRVVQIGKVLDTARYRRMHTKQERRKTDRVPLDLGRPYTGDLQSPTGR